MFFRSVKRVIFFNLLFLGASSTTAQTWHWAFSNDRVHEIKLKFSQDDYWQKLTAIDRLFRGDGAGNWRGTDPTGWAAPSRSYAASGTEPPGGGNAGGPGNVSRMRPLFTRLLKVPKYQQRYGELYNWFANQFVISDQVTVRMQVLHEMIRPYVERDVNMLSTLEQFNSALTRAAETGRPGAIGGIQGNAPGLIPFFRQRLDYVRKQVALNADGTWTFPA